MVGGTTHPNSATESLIEGAAHMGLSVVLGEALRFDENSIPLKHLEPKSAESKQIVLPFSLAC